MYSMVITCRQMNNMLLGLHVTTLYNQYPIPLRSQIISGFTNLSVHLNLPDPLLQMKSSPPPAHVTELKHYPLESGTDDINH